MVDFSGSDWHIRTSKVFHSQIPSLRDNPIFARSCRITICDYCLNTAIRMIETHQSEVGTVSFSSSLGHTGNFNGFNVESTCAKAYVAFIKMRYPATAAQYTLRYSHAVLSVSLD